MPLVVTSLVSILHSVLLEWWSQEYSLFGGENSVAKRLKTGIAEFSTCHAALVS